MNLWWTSISFYKMQNSLGKHLFIHPWYAVPESKRNMPLRAFCMCDDCLFWCRCVFCVILWKLLNFESKFCIGPLAPLKCKKITIRNIRQLSESKLSVHVFLHASVTSLILWTYLMMSNLSFFSSLFRFEKLICQFTSVCWMQWIHVLARSNQR